MSVGAQYADRSSDRRQVVPSVLGCLLPTSLSCSHCQRSRGRDTRHTRMDDRVVRAEWRYSHTASKLPDATASGGRRLEVRRARHADQNTQSDENTSHVGARSLTHRTALPAAASPRSTSQVRRRTFSLAAMREVAVM